HTAGFACFTEHQQVYGTSNITETGMATARKLAAYLFICALFTMNCDCMPRRPAENVSVEERVALGDCWKHDCNGWLSCPGHCSCPNLILRLFGKRNCL
ncbi:hypothetical protein MTO96_032955, partial [Rhipicephalus appendiculatus]